MDTARKIGLLQRQIEEAHDGLPADFKKWRERTRASLRAAFPKDEHWINRFEDVRYTPLVWSTATPDGYFSQVQADGVRSAIAVLEGAIHQLEVELGPGAELDVGGFHPWIKGAVEGLWDVAPPRMAVDEAAHKIEATLKALLGLDLTGTPLVTEAFNPKPGGKRLRFPGFETGTQAWTNAHEGAMNFARGCMLRLRNIAEHHTDEFSREEALEALGAFSLLARWIESAEVVEG